MTFVVMAVRRWQVHLGYASAVALGVIGGIYLGASVSQTAI